MSRQSELDEQARGVLKTVELSRLREGCPIRQEKRPTADNLIFSRGLLNNRSKKLL